VTTIDFIHFLAFLLIAGAMIRFVELRWPESTVGRTLGVIY
jgi:hypothetical protein